MHYSPATGGFYRQDIHGANMPEDCVEISNELYAELLAGQSSGKVIAWDKKKKSPILSDRPAPSRQEILASVDANRAAAYRNEADPLFFQYQRGDVTREVWLAKINEIKTRYPKPE